MKINSPTTSFFNPNIHLNYRFGEFWAPYVRAGRAYSWGDAVESLNFREVGVGGRIYFDHLIPFKDEWTIKRIHLSTFFDYSWTDYGLDEILHPIPIEFGEGRIIRVGTSMMMRVGRSLSIGVDWSCTNRRAYQPNRYFQHSLRIGYHLEPVERIKTPN